MPDTAETPKVRPITVATVNTKKKDAELDLHSLAEEDLKSLQKSDPFMYYSIPAVLEAERSLNEVDHSNVLQEQAGPRCVTRNSRVSFEKHASVIMEEILGDNELNGLDDFDSSDVMDVLSDLYFTKQ